MVLVGGGTEADSPKILLSITIYYFTEWWRSGGVGGGMDNSINFSSPTVGQYRGVARPVGLERQMDQNDLD